LLLYTYPKTNKKLHIIFRTFSTHHFRTLKEVALVLSHFKSLHACHVFIDCRKLHSMQ